MPLRQSKLNGKQGAKESCRFFKIHAIKIQTWTFYRATLRTLLTKLSDFVNDS
jgi:hypothetical protein